MKKYCAIALLLLFFTSIHAQDIYPTSDKLATAETVELYSSMQRLVGAGALFGHHDDTAYGVGWRYQDNRSDIKSVTGS